MLARLKAIPPAAAACFSLLALATLAIYAHLLSFDFVGFDDPFFVVNNALVQEGLSAKGMAWALTTGAQSNWHPLTWFSHMLDVELFGLNSSGHHATALGLHVANTLLVFLVLRTMTGATWRSAAVAGLFSLHPLHVESVAWVSARGNILSTFFGLVALAFYVGYVRGHTTFRLAKKLQLQSYGIVLTCFALSLMAKPMWITLPFVLLLLDYWPLGRLRGGPSAALSIRENSDSTVRHAPMELVREKFPLFAIGLIAAVITYVVQYVGGNTMAYSASGPMPLLLRGANGLVSYVRYLGKTVWPTDLSPLYPHPFVVGSGAVPWTAVEIAGALALLAAITLLVVRLRGRRPYALVGWFWFVGTLLPAIGFVQIGTQAMADRYTYIPLTGLFIAFVWGAGDLARRTGRPGRVVVATAVALIIAASGAVSHVQSQHWANGQTLSRRAVEVTPGNPKMLVGLGWSLAKQGNGERAQEFYERALEARPGYGLANFGLGQLYQDQGRGRQAIKYFRKAAESAAKNSYFQFKLGVALAQAGQIEQALSRFQASLEHLSDDPTDMDPNPVDLYLVIGNAYHLKGRLDEAVRHYRKGLELAPERAGDFQPWIERAERDQKLVASSSRLARGASAQLKATPVGFTRLPASRTIVSRRSQEPRIPASAGPVRF